MDMKDKRPEKEVAIFRLGKDPKKRPEKKPEKEVAIFRLDKDTRDDRMKETDKQQDLILAALGERKALHAILKALDYDTKRDIFEYIIRCYDLRELKEDE